MAEDTLEEAAMDIPESPTGDDSRPKFYTAVEDLSATEENGSDSDGADVSASASAGSEHCSQRRSDKVEFKTAFTQLHWTELAYSSDDEDDGMSNREAFEHFMKHPDWGDFFQDLGDRLVLGKKLAEGGQAEIFKARLQADVLEAHLQDTPQEPSSKRSRRSELAGLEDSRLWKFLNEGDRVLKVFKTGYSVRGLRRQWPLGVLRREVGYLTPVAGATLLNDGRFAFVMMKGGSDLRKMLDKGMKSSNNRDPALPLSIAMLAMSHIAYWMLDLHAHGILHRDLNANNVLLSAFQSASLDGRPKTYGFTVVDYECSLGVQGTGFWRAPEILQKNVKGERVPLDFFTDKVDVYSYGMTCYEIMTGLTPFQTYPRGCRTREDVMKRIVDGHIRPELPGDLHPTLKNLITRCWHQDPAQRPTFAAIRRGVKGFEQNVALDPIWHRFEDAD